MFSTSARQGGTDTTAVTTAKKAGPAGWNPRRTARTLHRVRGQERGISRPDPAAEKRIWEKETESVRLKGCPGRRPTRSAKGARPILENSTACQKSMPITSFRGGSWLDLMVWLWVASNEFPLVDNEFLAIASCSCSVSELTLLGFRFSCRTCCGGWQTSMESLILAQDERWRRA